MDIKITRVDKSLPLPKYQTEDSAAFDMYSRETITIEPNSIAILPSNFIIETPLGYALYIISRSSTPRKKGLFKPHGIGVVDPDYSGETDEIGLQVFNFTDKPVTVERGERIAQGMFVKIPHVNFIEQEKAKAESRGGFGSTGTHV